MLKADLHIHTTASDGRLSPAQVVHAAAQTDLDVIAITDHDTTDGYPEAFEAAQKTSLKVLRGVEISTLFAGRECHLLAYGFDDDLALTRLLRRQKSRRSERARTILASLARLGFELDFEDVRAEAGSAPIGRPHIARMLVKKGYVATNQEAFLRYLGKPEFAMHTPGYPETTEVIQVVHNAGGVAVLAHPAGRYNFIQIKYLKDHGLDGIECYHPSHNSSHRQRYLEYCNSHDLLVTGGSDFHGNVHDYYNLGGVQCQIAADSPIVQNRVHSEGVLT